jgi:hypothetical protein
MQKPATHKPRRAKNINDAFMKRINENRDNVIDFTEEHKSEEQIVKVQNWLNFKKG